MKRIALTILGLGLTVASCKQEPAQKPEPTKVAETPKKAAPVAAASQPAEKKVVPGNSAATREHIDEDGVVRRGEALSAREHLSVAIAMAKSSELDGKPVKLTGTVGKVCEKKGCWFVLQEGEQQVRITSKGYKFFVPSTSVGMVATVEGEFHVKTLDKADAEHLAAEGAPIKADLREMTIEAVGVELKKKEG